MNMTDLWRWGMPEVKVTGDSVKLIVFMAGSIAALYGIIYLEEWLDKRHQKKEEKMTRQ
jgi:hypothetical protein